MRAHMLTMRMTNLGESEEEKKSRMIQQNILMNIAMI